MQIVSIGDNLHEMAKPVFQEKIRKNILTCYPLKILPKLLIVKGQVQTKHQTWKLPNFSEKIKSKTFFFYKINCYSGVYHEKFAKQKKKVQDTNNLCISQTNIMATLGK